MPTSVSNSRWRPSARAISNFQNSACHHKAAWRFRKVVRETTPSGHSPLYPTLAQATSRPRLHNWFIVVKYGVAILWLMRVKYAQMPEKPLQAERRRPAHITATTAGSVYRRAGRLLGLSSPLRSEIDLVNRLERGFSVTVIQALQTRLGLTDEEIYELVAPRRTLERRAASGQPLSSGEADRAVRVARTAALAQQVFSGRSDYAQEWLRAKQPALGDRSPLQALTSESGARAVEEILLGIEHGFFA